MGLATLRRHRELLQGALAPKEAEPEPAAADSKQDKKQDEAGKKTDAGKPKKSEN